MPATRVHSARKKSELKPPSWIFILFIRQQASNRWSLALGSDQDDYSIDNAYTTTSGEELSLLHFSFDKASEVTTLYKYIHIGVKRKKWAA